MNSLDLDGGDIFLYPYWYELVCELHKYNYSTYLSTKTPITKEIVEKLLKAGEEKIQLSLDTINENEAIKILKVRYGYIEKIKKGIALLNDAKIRIIVKPVITKYNDSVKSIEEMISFLSQFEMVEEINLTPGEQTRFKDFNYSTSLEQLSRIKDKIDYWRSKYSKKIVLYEPLKKLSVNEREKTFPTRASCTGNISEFFVLPDGKVTICEQMYRHPFFVLGDLSTQSIMEVWNSPKAISLWNFSKDDVRPISACKTCESFEQCRKGQGCCWRMIVNVFGDENYDYPDIYCPKAPTIPQDVLIS